MRFDLNKIFVFGVFSIKTITKDNVKRKIQIKYKIVQVASAFCHNVLITKQSDSHERFRFFSMPSN